MIGDKKPLPITNEDVEDIRAVAEARMGDSNSVDKPTVTVTYTNGGVIVTAHNSHHPLPASTLREALRALGYVVGRDDFSFNAVVVIGRDPGHVWSKGA